MSPLDAPIWQALAGPHARLALVKGRARRYPAEVSPFAAVETLDDDALSDLAALVSAGDVIAVFCPAEGLPERDWKRLFWLDGSQWVCESAVTSGFSGERGDIRCLFHPFSKRFDATVDPVARD